MRGKPKSLKGKATQIGVYMDKRNLKWLEEKVKEGKFASRSEGIRECVTIVRGLTLEAVEASDLP